MIVHGVGVVTLKCGGEVLDAVVVGGGLLFWCGECCSEVA